MASAREDQTPRLLQVAEIVRAELDRHFQQHPAFGPILVDPAVDEYGDGDGSIYLRIRIIFDGDPEDLDSTWTSGLIRRIRPKLLDIGVKEFPVPSFIEKTEWDRWARRNPRAQVGAG